MKLFKSASKLLGIVLIIALVMSMGIMAFAEGEGGSGTEGGTTEGGGTSGGSSGITVDTPDTLPTEGTGTITLQCYGDVPAIDLPIQIIVLAGKEQ